MRSNPGTHNRLLVIEQHNGATDSLGELDRSDANWSEHSRHYGGYKTRGGREFFRADAVDGEVTSVIELPWSPKAAGITRQMRVVDGARKLNIVAAVDVDDAHERINLHCTEDT